jgi:hypothetical protein
MTKNQLEEIIILKLKERFSNSEVIQISLDITGISFQAKLKDKIGNVFIVKDIANSIEKILYKIENNNLIYC